MRKKNLDKHELAINFAAYKYPRNMLYDWYKVYIYFFFLAACCLTAVAQQPLSIYGTVINENDAPLPAVHVSLLRSSTDSNVVAITTTDSDGKFKINNQDGLRPIKFTCLGYAQKTLLADSGNIGTIILTPEAIAIDEITISRQSKTYRPDGITYIPTGKQVDRAVNGMDLLSNLRPPRVRIDPLSYTISAMGGGQVMVLINDRPANTNELRGINPDLIRRVDYYDKPTSRFPEAAIVINITVARPPRGISAFKQLDNSWNNDFSGQIITQNNTAADTTRSHEHNAERVSSHGMNIYSEIKSPIGPFRINANYQYGAALYERDFSEHNAINSYFTNSINTENKHHTGLQGSYTLPFPLGDSFDGTLTLKST